MVSKELKRFLIDPRKIFFGWWMTVAGGLLCLWGYGYHSYGISALFKPISEELGFSRAATSVAASITRFEGGLEAPLVGYLSDRYGPRITVFIGIFMFGLGMLLMYRVNSLWTFYLVWAVICSTGINISLSMPLDVAITNWFIKKRGTALGIKWGFSGFSGVIGLPIVAWLTASYGWRIACVIGGMVMLIIGLPLVWFFIRSRRPEYYGLLPDGDSLEVEDTDDAIQAGIEYAAMAGEAEFTATQAIRTNAFWLLVVAYMFHGALYPVMSIHCIPFLTDRGMDPLVAAMTMSVYVFASIPARLFGGILVDHVRTPLIRFVMAGAYLLQCFGVTLFLFNQQSMAALYIFFVLYGVGMGAAMTMTPVLRARYFGRRAFGTIAGISRALNTPVGVIGPVAAGWIYDSTGSYMTAFTIFAVMLGISAVIMSSIRPPIHPQ
jgi:sugar phosphate permease